MSTNSTQIKLSFPEWFKLRRDIAKLTQADIAKAVKILLAKVIRKDSSVISSRMISRKILGNKDKELWLISK